MIYEEFRGKMRLREKFIALLKTVLKNPIPLINELKSHYKKSKIPLYSNGNIIGVLDYLRGRFNLNRKEALVLVYALVKESRKGVLVWDNEYSIDKRYLAYSTNLFSNNNPFVIKGLEPFNAIILYT